MRIDTDWTHRVLGDAPPLELVEVHVWRVDVSALPDRILLSDEEKSRAGKFLNAAARTRFVACRTALRRILSRYLGREPLALSIAYAAHGKPFLISDNPIDLRFNCSHSGGVGLIAITRGREVGVDVEQVREDLDYLELAERFFAPGEISFVHDATPEVGPQRFFDCWTRKEAWMKAAGVGLTQSPQLFDVSRSLIARESHLEGPLREARSWSLGIFPVDPLMPGAVVVEGAATSVKLLKA